MRDEGWRDDAACRTADTALFFPPRGATDQWQTALAICATCSVQQRCLDYAMAHGIRIGVWGGHSAESRRKIRRRRPAPLGEPERIEIGYRRTA